MLVEITFYEKPSPEGKRIRKMAKAEVVTEAGLIGALDSIRGSIAKSQDADMVARVAQVKIEIKENGAI